MPNTFRPTSASDIGCSELNETAERGDGRSMIEKTYSTFLGNIHYWVSEQIDMNKFSLIFLPGLTTDHRLFEKQIAYFEDRYNIFVWDAPGHASSFPFRLTFSLADESRWLDHILCAEKMTKPIIIGQAMAGAIGQVYGSLYPEKLRGYIAIGSAPLARSGVTEQELLSMKHMNTVYKDCPWSWLLTFGVNSAAITEYGKKLMQKMLLLYDGQKERYAELCCHGAKILADAMEKERSYIPKCPSLILCGEKDHSYNRHNPALHQKIEIPVEWIKNAGHHIGSDQPQILNERIERFIQNLNDRKREV